MFVRGRGKIKAKAFGTTLDVSVKRNTCATKLSYVADVVTLSLRRLNEHDSLTETGLYRVPGSVARVKTLRESFDNGIAVDLSDESTHDVASLLKLYLRELPTPLIDEETSQRLMDSLDECADDTAKSVCEGLDGYTLALLYILLKHLRKVADHQEENKMNESNICIVFSATTKLPQDVLRYFLDNFHSIFDSLKVELEQPDDMEDEGATSENGAALEARVRQLVATNECLEAEIGVVNSLIKETRAQSSLLRVQLDSMGVVGLPDLVDSVTLPSHVRNHDVCRDISTTNAKLDQVWQSIAQIRLENVAMRAKLMHASPAT
eukprot:CFRG2814T1